MILTCPSCSTRYLLPPAALQPSGRDVRCAKCGHSWFQESPTDLPKGVEIVEPPTDTLAADPGPLVMSRPAKRGVADVLAWVVLVALLLGGLAGLVQWRDKVVATWPPIAKLYELVGLPVAAYGLTLAPPQTERISENGVDVLVVTGEVGLDIALERPVPPVWVSLLDGNNRILRRELVATDPNVLSPNKVAKYRVRFVAPPAEAAKVAAGFGDQP